jgi:4'-phosphopantetheinyl transferase
VLSHREIEGSGRPEQLLAVEGAIDLWIVDYRDRGDLAQRLDLLLSEDELERAGRFKFDHLRDFYFFCRGSLRRILSHYSAIPPDKIEFLYEDKGKPYLAHQSRIRFNVSHAGDLFVCAVSNSLTVGVDVEEILQMEDMASIATHFFAPAEQDHLAGIAEGERTHAFYECWTRKEAVIKATGEGVSRPLDSFEVAFGPGVAAQLIRIDDDVPRSWQMESFEPRPGYVVALTSPERWSSLRVYE